MFPGPSGPGSRGGEGRSPIHAPDSLADVQCTVPYFRTFSLPSKCTVNVFLYSRGLGTKSLANIKRAAPVAAISFPASTYSKSKWPGPSQRASRTPRPPMVAKLFFIHHSRSSGDCICWPPISLCQHAPPSLPYCVSNLNTSRQQGQSRGSITSVVRCFFLHEFVFFVVESGPSTTSAPVVGSFRCALRAVDSKTMLTIYLAYGR